MEVKIARKIPKCPRAFGILLRCLVFYKEKNWDRGSSYNDYTEGLLGKKSVSPLKVSRSRRSTQCMVFRYSKYTWDITQSGDAFPPHLTRL